MTPNSIATELYDEIGDTTNINVSGVSYWLMNNIGKLNTLIFTELQSPNNINGYFYISDTGSSDMTERQKGILKLLYENYYYQKMVNTTLGAASLDPFVEISSDGATVRKINKNELSKTYIALRKEAYEELTNQINSYKLYESNPQQVAGDDTFPVNTPIVHYPQIIFP